MIGVKVNDVNRESFVAATRCWKYVVVAVVLWQWCSGAASESVACGRRWRDLHLRTVTSAAQKRFCAARLPLWPLVREAFVLNATADARVRFLCPLHKKKKRRRRKEPLGDGFQSGGPGARPGPTDPVMRPNRTRRLHVFLLFFLPKGHVIFFLAENGFWNCALPALLLVSEEFHREIPIRLPKSEVGDFLVTTLKWTPTYLKFSLLEIHPFFNYFIFFPQDKNIYLLFIYLLFI